MMDSDSGEISKFIKFLAFKSTQIIVQSRLGGLIYTKCNNTGTDWVSKTEIRNGKFTRRSSTKTKELKRINNFV